jgi:hypothetical protein
MQFNFIIDNLSLFSCILVKESLISWYKKSDGINNRNIIIAISCFLYISERRYSTLNLIECINEEYYFINDHSTKIILSVTTCLFCQSYFHL